jgi:hypothetical protein
MYSYSTSQLEEDIKHRLNDLRSPADQRYEDDAIRQAIIKALRWADPLGELITFDLSAAEYALTPQTAFQLLEILQVETRAPYGPQIIVPPSLWNFMRGQAKVIRLTYPPTDESIIITGMLRNETTGMEIPSETATTIKIDPTLVELYATSYLYERESQWNAPGSVTSEVSRAADYRMQADIRKTQMLEEIRSVYRAIPIQEGDQPMSAPAKKPTARRRS